MNALMTINDKRDRSNSATDWRSNEVRAILIVWQVIRFRDELQTHVLLHVQPNSHPSRSRSLVVSLVLLLRLIAQRRIDHIFRLFGQGVFLLCFLLSSLSLSLFRFRFLVCCRSCRPTTIVELKKQIDWNMNVWRKSVNPQEIDVIRSAAVEQSDGKRSWRPVSRPPPPPCTFTSRHLPTSPNIVSQPKKSSVKSQNPFCEWTRYRFECKNVQTGQSTKSFVCVTMAMPVAFAFFCAKIKCQRIWCWQMMMKKKTLKTIGSPHPFDLARFDRVFLRSICSTLTVPLKIIVRLLCFARVVEPLLINEEKETAWTDDALIFDYCRSAICSINLNDNYNYYLSFIFLLFSGRLKCV